LRVARTILAMLIAIGLSAAIQAGAIRLGANTAHYEMAAAIPLDAAASSDCGDCGDCGKDNPCPNAACAMMCSLAAVPFASATALPSPTLSFARPTADGQSAWLASLQPPPPKA
jgi:hypothetical protein